ncbi:tyrosine-type recombinase/integrase [Lysobacter maris]|uniref:Tyrosine-type recombinase/integrase n=1 Tax=Marilutibacter maris TaxID=1605891 RepID=A0A508A0Q8_9GAMM|nr:site-specific integrase [Lysobacter maris]KAB8168479.1 tyrosine-type recombinase/integrase [Lysobacter maris]
MAQITKRGELQWRARVRVKGYPEQSRTFMYREDADRWARAVERELETSGFVDRREAEKTSLRAVLERYQREVTPGKKSAEIEKVKIRVLLRDPVLPNLKMSAISSAAVAAWRDRRLAEVSAGTVIRELGILSAALNHARREWGIHVENPIRYVKRPPTPRSRDRRLTAEEESYLLAALEQAPRKPNGTFGKGGSRNPWIAPLIQLAIETAMRRGELLALDWRHVDLRRRTAHLPETKNGDARTVPLSSRAVEILKDLPRAFSGNVFPTTAMAVKLGFARAIKRAQETYLRDCQKARRPPSPGFLEDVHFHDLRHEAASRMADKLANVLELSAVTGHRDLRMLKRYYHPRAEDLAKKLG